MLYNVILAASMATTVLGHGLVISPPIRAAGPAMDTACGKSVAALVAEDPTSHVEGMPEAALELGKAFDPVKCNLFLCKGLQFGDNAKNVQTFTPGQKVAIKANITIPHEGPANVSIVDTKTNTMIGTPLLSFSTYADEKLKTLPANNTAFEITIPTTLGDKCAVAGACVCFRPLLSCSAPR